MSKKYVSPILKKIEQVKSNEDFGEQLRIREIDDLFAFLEEKDNYYEQQLDNHFRFNVVVATAVADSMVYDKKRKAA